MSVSYVYVQNMSGQPLMPTSPRNARVLLRGGRASVVQRCPFTIRLKYPSGEARQEVRLGFDPLYANGGLSAISNGKEVFSAAIKLRTDIPELLEDRKMYRRLRRSRLRYRKSRFLNRARREDWLAPSMQHRLDAYDRLFRLVKSILPVKDENIIVEIAKFDTQKMMNPEISGVEYQQGTLYGYTVRKYLLDKWGRGCAYCGKRNVPLQVEHIVPKLRRGGSDRESNLTLACSKCNQKKGNMTAEEFGNKYPKYQEACLKIEKHRKEALTATAFMNLIRKRFVKGKMYQTIYGSETQYRRVKLGLEKSHINDAFVIAGGKTEERCRPFFITQVRRNDRAIQTNNRKKKCKYDKKLRRKRKDDKEGLGRSKGCSRCPSRLICKRCGQVKGTAIKKKRYPIRLGDFVEFKGIEYMSGGICGKGKNVYLKGYKNPNGKKNIAKFNDVKFIRHGQGFAIK